MRLDYPPMTIADGARTVQIGERTFAVLSELCAGISLVDDDAARRALALVWRTHEAPDRADLGAADRGDRRRRRARASASASYSRAATSTPAPWPRRSASRRRDDRGTPDGRRGRGRRVGRVTTKGPAEQRMRSADEGLLQRQEDPGFVHTDPWRVLRIMGEFVDGFDVLARVGLAVTVFGSARVKADSPYYAAAREVGRGHRRARLRGDHRRRARDHGGGQPRRQRGRRALDRLQHRAAARAVAQPVREPLDRLPLLLRAQDDVRQVLRGVRHLPGRLRHAGRAVRGADADPDREGQALPGRALRLASTGAACSTGSAERLLAEGMVSAGDLALVQVVDTTDEVCAIATGGAPR